MKMEKRYLTWNSANKIRIELGCSVTGYFGKVPAAIGALRLRNKNVSDATNAQ